MYHPTSAQHGIPSKRLKSVLFEMKICALCFNEQFILYPIIYDLEDMLVVWKRMDWQRDSAYILWDVLVCSIAEYFHELCCILTSPLFVRDKGGVNVSKTVSTGSLLYNN